MRKALTLLILLFLLINLYSQPELKIGKISFEGNNFFSDSELYKTIQSRDASHFNQGMLNDDVKRIADLYKNKGYLNLKVAQPEIFTNDPSRIDVVFRIEEMGRLMIDDLVISGNKYVSEKKIKNNLDTEVYFSKFNVMLQNIVEYYNDIGFLFAEAKSDSFKIIDGKLAAFVSITENSQSSFDDFRFKGNKITKETTLLKLSQLAKVEIVTPDIINSAEELIRKKPYIKECTIVPLDHRTVIFDVIEDKMTLFSGIMGYDNSQLEQNKFTGFLNLEFLNLFGTDRAISLMWKRLKADRSSIELKYHESGPNTIPLSGDILFFREEADSTYIKSTVETDIYYYSMWNKYGLYAGIDDFFPGRGRPITIERASYKKLGGFWKFNNQDYYLNPTKGSFAYLKYYYIFHSYEGENISKQAAEMTYLKNLKLRNKTVLTGEVNAKVIENKELNNDLEYFYMGGTSGLRGFTEKQFFGYFLAWSELELRYLLSKKSRAFLFLDYGFAESNEYTYGKLFGYGLGLRIETRLGMLGIDYGLSYSNGEFRNPLDGIIHFGIQTKL
jgi:outer membrane protein assembly factor BamA